MTHNQIPDPTPVPADAASRPRIHIVDIGRTSRGLIHFLRDAAYAAECKRRRVRFLPAQVLRRAIGEITFDSPAQAIALKP